MASPADLFKHCLPLLRVTGHLLILIDCFVASADLQIGVMLRMVFYEQLIVLNLEVAQGRCALHVIMSVSVPKL